MKIYRLVRKNKLKKITGDENETRSKQNNINNTIACILNAGHFFKR